MYIFELFIFSYLYIYIYIERERERERERGRELLFDESSSNQTTFQLKRSFERTPPKPGLQT